MAKRGRKRKAHEPAGAEPPVAAAAAAASPQGDEPAPSEPAAAAPPGKATPIALAFIALFLLYQVAMPLAYYLGGRGTDERFSWRMFSSVRMQRCSVDVDETVGGEKRAVDLDREVQIAWVGMLERYRPTVVEKLLRRRCERAQASEVRYVRNCVETDGSQSPALKVTLDCEHGKLSSAEEPAP
jgi:hypothetical protein